jgi:hypothetical protein
MSHRLQVAGRYSNRGFRRHFGNAVPIPARDAPCGPMERGRPDLIDTQRPRQLGRAAERSNHITVG